MCCFIVIESISIGQNAGQRNTNNPSSQFSNKEKHWHSGYCIFLAVYKNWFIGDKIFGYQRLLYITYKNTKILLLFDTADDRATQRLAFQIITRHLITL